MLGIFFSPIILWVLLYLVARHTAELDLGVVFFVSLGITIAGWFLVEAFGTVPGFAAQAILAGYLLMRFCCLTLMQMVIVVVAFVMCNTALSMAMG